jgi:hypothetical protein
MSNVEWYYLDTTSVQRGPATQAELKQAWNEGKLDANGLIWNEDMPDWAVVSRLRRALVKFFVLERFFQVRTWFTDLTPHLFSHAGF